MITTIFNEIIRHYVLIVPGVIYLFGQIMAAVFFDGCWRYNMTKSVS